MIILDQVKICWASEKFVGQAHFQSTCHGATEMKKYFLALL